MKAPFTVRPPMGIRKRLFFLLLVVFVPLLLLEVFIFYRWYEDRKKSEMQANLELARAVGRNFETFLQGLVRSEVGIGLALTASPSITDQDRNSMLDTFAANNPAARSVMWLNPDGRVVAASYRPHIGYDLSDRSFFAGVKEGRDWVVGGLIIGRDTKKPAVTIGCGIRDKQGRLLGLVAFATELDRLDAILGIVRSGDAGVSLIDNKGMHAYRYPPTAYTWEQRNWINLYPVIGEVMKGKEVVTIHESKIRGSNRIVAFTPVASIGWVASCSRAEREVIAAILQTILPQALLILLLTLAAFGAAVILSRPISTAIRKLQDHAAALGKGEVQRLEKPFGPREIKNLAETFTEMAEKVRSREEALRMSEERLRATLRSAADEIWIVDMQGRIVSLSDSVMENLGISSDKWADVETALDQSEILRPDRTPRPREQAILLRALRGKVIKNEGEMIRNLATGQLRWREVSGAPIRDAEERIIGAVAVVRDITESKKAEVALRASEEKYRNLFENIEEMVTVYEVERDDNGQIIERWLRDANPAFLRAVGVSSIDEIRGKASSQIFGKVWSEFHLPAIQKVMDTGQVQVQEVYRPESSRHYITSVVRLDTHTYMVTGWDITERKQAEENAAAAHMMIQSIIDNATSIIYAFDLEERFLLANVTLAELLNSTPEQMSGKRRHEFMPKDDADWHEANDRRVIETGRALEFEEHSQLKDRSITWLTTKFPIRDLQGRIYAVGGISADFSERKQAEEELKRQRQLLQTVLNNIPVAVNLIRGKDLTIHLFNPAYQAIGPGKEILGKTLDEVWPEAGRKFEDLCRQVLATGEPYHVEDDPVTISREPVGTPELRYFTWSLLRVRMPGEEGWGILNPGWETTERRLVQEELRKSRDELDRRVLERTAELERKNQELQEFSFVASHDLNEPLRKIQTFGTLLEEKCANRLEESEKGYITRMTAAAGRMQDLLAALLNYSRIEAKGEPFRPTLLADVVRDAVSDLEVIIRQAGAQVMVNPLPTVHGDPNQLRQLFQNLVGNAIKYQRSDIATVIKISGEKENGKCRVLVEDNGIGFDEKYLGKIFQPFQRLHGRDEYPGIGIGLAICKKIVERHRGTITAKSAPGKGSTFIVTLPVNGTNTMNKPE